ncbi:MAG: GAF domain-containing protein [Rickettsiales bacterium]|nr:GAF domain-containing protein [Rickettsiales bacterium]
MSKPALVQENFSENSESLTDLDPIATLKQLAAESVDATILCETKKNNPNYFSIVFANQKFYEIFNIAPHNLIGKNYDFLFADLDLDYSSEDQMEYVRLIKAVKDFHACAVIISTPDYQLEGSKIKLKIDFKPIEITDGEINHHATFVFKKIDSQEDVELEDAKKEAKLASQNLLKNLERTLRSERLLRKVGSLIISDLEIREIAKEIAKILCEHLKVDRCILHDYDLGATSFVVEYTNDYTRKILKDKTDPVALKIMSDYVNFQNQFFKKFGKSDKKSSLTVVEDVSSDRNFAAIQDLCKAFGVISQIAVTTTFNEKINGGIYIHQASRRSWLVDEIELIETIADQFSIALDRSKSIERVMIANHALLEKTSQLKEALKHEQDMRQMQNEFVALVSHEFKTPLQIIDSTRELLVRKVRNLKIADESLDKGFERIKAGIQRMNGLIHSTLNLAKMESGDGKIKLDKQIFDFKAFVLDVIEKNSNLATNKQIKVLTRIDELPTEFNGDAKLLEHSVTNIISNAIKYSKDGTTVRILAKANASKIALRVIDQGMGIPKEDLSSIGQKFFRAKNTLAVAGTGIGIYLTKHFIELHGGEFHIESELDVGTSVTVTLPK